MIPARVSFAIIALLLVMRATAAALLPLSADEAYYWLWSKHLAAGYYDHPPLIAWLIRGGTALFGDTPLGVRFAGLLLSVPLTWHVWKSASFLLQDGGGRSSACAAKTGGGDEKAALAALFFNLTLMVSVEMLAATPDMPSIVTSAAFFQALCRVQATNKGRWWLVAGIAAGLGLLAKFSALFLGAGALVWLLADRRARPWLLTPWPYAGAIIALLIFSPNLIWQSQHHWETFAFQFGRVGEGHLTLRYLGEFIAAQFGLATPLIFALMVWGAIKAMRRESPLLMPAVIVLTGFAYFLVHALHDRVQGNWPCFLYPMLAVLAVSAIRDKGWWRWVGWVAAPLAAILLLALYAQALWGVIPLKNDPAARLLGRDFAPIANVAAALGQAHLADAVLTTDYETTAWLRFTEPGLKVIQVNDPQRYPDAPAPSADLLNGHLVYLTELKRDQHPLVQKYFAYTGFPTQMQSPGALYMLYPVGHPKVPSIGKMP